jgi:hypothetical protein
MLSYLYIILFFTLSLITYLIFILSSSYKCSNICAASLFIRYLTLSLYYFILYFISYYLSYLYP